MYGQSLEGIWGEGEEGEGEEGERGKRERGREGERERGRLTPHLTLLTLHSTLPMLLNS
jgi:hypothetical protein